MGESPLTIVHVASIGGIGDNVYRVHEPAAAMARLPGVAVYDVHSLSRYRDAAALAADVLVLFMTTDVEVFRLVHQRRLLGKPTFCEINDFFPDVQTCNPVHRSWSDERAHHMYRELMAGSDAMQVSSAALAQRFRDTARRVVVFENQIASLPPPRPPRANHETVIGWGGSAGHLQDLAHVAPALTRWLCRRADVRLEVMGDPAFAELFAGAPRERFVFRRGGSLAHYLDWLDTIDIGIAPLLPTEYNRCRSDVKFLEYAAHGVASVLQRLDPYDAAVRDGEMGLLFADEAEMLAALDRLVDSAPLRARLAAAAHEYVRRERRLDDHVAARVEFYREHAARSPVAEIPDALAKAGALPLTSLPGRIEIAPDYWRIDLGTTEERHFAAGVEALQTGDIRTAGAQLTEAVRLAPDYAQALSLLGQCLLQTGRLGEARQAFERAAALDPLFSRPLRGLARLHRHAAEEYERRAAALNPIRPRSARVRTG